MKVDGVDLTVFADGVTAKELREDRYREVPPRSGVYVVIRYATAEPIFLKGSGAGRFKGLDPYIGKAGGARGLKQRHSGLIDFGLGKPVGHRGGLVMALDQSRGAAHSMA